MKVISWANFRRNPGRSFSDFGNELRVSYDRQGGYFDVKYVPGWSRGYRRKGQRLEGLKTGRVLHLCLLCNTPKDVRWTVPYDGCVVPSYYCWRCRRRHDILDVYDAERLGKI